MMLHSSRTAGTAAMLFYALVTALASIFIHQASQQIHPLLAAFYTFLFCLVFYNIFAAGLLAKLPLVLKSWSGIVVLNLTTAVSWIFSFLSLKFIQPELYLFVYLSAMPVTCLLLTKTGLFKGVLSFIVLILLVMTYKGADIVSGASLAFAGGVSGMVYTWFAKRLSETFTSLEILSLRFFLTVIISLVLSLHLGIMKQMNAGDYLELGVLSFTAVILPLILFQLGIKNLPVARAMSYLPLAPILCYLINLVTGASVLDPLQMAAVVLLGAILLKPET